MREESPVKRSPRILILTASYGDGHVQASRALDTSFRQLGIEDVRIVDLMREAHPLLNSITTKLYVTSTQTSRYGLDYYGWSYYLTRDSKYDGSWGKYFNYLGRKKLQEIIQAERPDAIINTFPFGAAPEIGRSIGIPTFMIITDYALHSRWIHPGIHKYYVAVEKLKAELTEKGIDPATIEVSGIPVRSAFYTAAETGSRYRKLFDPDKKIVLISAGSYGVLDQIEEIAGSLLTRCRCQLALVCGRNRKLQDKLQAHFAGNDDIRVFGFVEPIHELMALSSCIVTKAGGLTLSEALTLRIPMFIFKPFAGQEKENAWYFAGKGIAEIAGNIKELEEQIVRFLSSESYAQSMRMRMEALRKENAAELITRDVLRTAGLITSEPVFV
jgi:processive 1,2-diacylglycerol beta-glucosyltransferase